jgi:hypothetical protein
MFIPKKSFHYAYHVEVLTTNTFVARCKYLPSSNLLHSSIIKVNGKAAGYYQTQ